MSSNTIYGKPEHFYVYAYIRSKDSKTAKAGTPYYIGKGSGDRAWVCDRNRNHMANKRGAKTPKDKSKIILLETNLTELGAFALERRLIGWWGRKDISTGILLNMTEGGEGASGCRFSHTEEHKLYISNMMKGRPAHNKGKHHTEETKTKISESNKGRRHSEETKTKISKTLKGHDVSIETRLRISENVKGKTKGHVRSEETRKVMKTAATNRELNYTEEQKESRKQRLLVMAKNRIGTKQSEETKTKRGETLKSLNLKRERVICEYCGKEIAINIYSRFHGTKCKLQNS